ncbi:MAG: glycosyltransferase family 4 protein [Bacteroidales bacterium]|nr:glycosyltransferase family 4 protein [Bacteroidales bacterium]
MEKKKLIRVSTIPVSMKVFCKDLLRDLSAEYEVVALSSPDKELEDIAREEGVRTIAVPMERKMAPFKDLRSLLRLIRVFCRERPDIVHSITPKAGLLSMMAARIAGVKCRIHTFTGLVFPTSTGLKRRILITTDRLTCRCATHIIPEGRGVMNDLKENRITKKPMRVLGYGNIKGVDMDYYTRSADVEKEALLLEDKTRFTFVFVGRIAREKGVQELISAFTRLDSGSFRLLMVGGWETEDPVDDRTASAIKEAGNITYYGPVADVRPYLAASDCLVLPSYREGFPNAVIEAGAMELPSVVTDINGANEIIAEEKNGLIVPAKDADALYSAMKRIAQDKVLYSDLKANARSMIASRFERGYVWSCLKDFYREALKDV